MSTRPTRLETVPDDVAALCRLIRTQSDQVGTGCTAIELALVGQMFPELPEDHLRYLTDIGWFTTSSHEVIGFGTDVPAHLDVVTVATWERERAEPAAWTSTARAARSSSGPTRTGTAPDTSSPPRSSAGPWACSVGPSGDRRAYAT